MTISSRSVAFFFSFSFFSALSAALIALFSLIPYTHTHTNPCLEKEKNNNADFVFVNLVYTVTEKILARDPMEEIRRAFQLFDDDNTGKISIRNLRRVAKEIGDRLEDDELYVVMLPRLRAWLMMMMIRPGLDKR